MYKFFVIAAVLAVANAGLLAPAYAPSAYAAPAWAQPAAVGVTAQSTLRSLDGNNVVSQFSKAVDTPYSSVRKYDTRISNDGVTLAHAYAPAAYASPLAARAYAPALAAPAYAAPLAARAVAAPVAHAGLLGVAYSAAPAVAHVTYDAPLSHWAW